MRFQVLLCLQCILKKLFFLFLFAESVLCVFSGLKDVFCPVNCRNKLIDTKFVKHTAPPTQGVALHISFQIFHWNYPPRCGPVSAQWQQTGENLHQSRHFTHGTLSKIILCIFLHVIHCCDVLADMASLAADRTSQHPLSMDS